MALRLVYQQDVMFVENWGFQFGNLFTGEFVEFLSGGNLIHGTKVSPFNFQMRMES
jgi:hypothetical protein